MGRSAYTDEIARRMFVATADDNYLLARLAHFHQLDIDFWWLSLHAVEKYLKAILLLNGRSARKGGHDVVKLASSVRLLDRRIAFGPLVDPGIAGLHWRATTTEEFLARLNEYGSATNRYMAYGYTVSLDDMVKVDQLIWSIRRLCQRLKVDIGGQSARVPVDMIEQLASRPDRWHLSGTLPLEHVLARPPCDPLRSAFLHLNTAFDRGGTFTLAGWSSSASNPPLADWVMRLRSSATTTDTRDTSAEVLEWVLANVFLPPSDVAALERELETAGYRVQKVSAAAAPHGYFRQLRTWLATMPLPRMKKGAP